MKKLFLAAFMIVLAISVKNAFGQTEPEQDSIQELELARALLSDMQVSLDSLDSNLLVPIEQLADSLIELNLFAEAHEYLDRAIQIVRADDGLYTEYQRPLLVKKIENYIDLDDWDNVRENLDHLSWLYITKSRRINENLVEDLLVLSRIHLRAFTEDVSLFEGYHLRQSARTRGMALAVARAIWGETDVRLAPMIYDQLRQLHLQTAALWHGGPASSTLRQDALNGGRNWSGLLEYAPSVGNWNSRFDVNLNYYFLGLGLFDELHGIYAEEEAQNLEGLAMANLYLADWHILYDMPEQAKETYRLAYDGLLTAGVEAALLGELFSQPMIIPESQFYATAGGALAAKQNRMVALGDKNSQNYLTFSEWSSVLPNVQSPINEDEQDLDPDYALFSFSLGEIGAVLPLDVPRSIKSVSMIEQAQVLNHSIEPPPAELLLLEKLNSLTFRPKLVGGTPQQFDGRLKYQIAD